MVLVVSPVLHSTDPLQPATLSSTDSPSQIVVSPTAISSILAYPRVTSSMAAQPVPSSTVHSSDAADPELIVAIAVGLFVGVTEASPDNTDQLPL